MTSRLRSSRARRRVDPAARHALLDALGLMAEDVNALLAATLAEGQVARLREAQLGHKSIAMTVDTYGRWLPKGTCYHWPGRAITHAAYGDSASGS